MMLFTVDLVLFFDVMMLFLKRFSSPWKCVCLSLLLSLFLFSCQEHETPTYTSPSDPYWVADAVFYQIFPTRFRNGDPTNDPDKSTLEFPEFVPDSWRTTPWTGDWYARDAWEVEKGEDFYDDGVFDRRYGGDLQGVIDKLDYLDNLGINALYFNPVFYANSLHKYDGNSFHHIDPHFGPDPEGDLTLIASETGDPSSWHVTAADSLFFELLNGAHARDMRVVIDGVFNHTGRNFFAFDDIRVQQEASPYKDWYIINAFDDPVTDTNEFSYEGWWGVETLPLFADTPDSLDLHPGPKAYVFDATRKWMDPNGDGNSEDGIDGWRLDVAPDVPIAFWADWNAFVRELNPDAYTVAEAWDDASNFLVDGGFSATMNYHAFAFPVKGFLIDNLIDADEFLTTLEERNQEYPLSMQYALQNLIDSHDTDRVASMIVNAKPVYDIPERYDYDHNVSPRWYPTYDVRMPNERERAIQRLVAFLQMTMPGAPMIYYGTEAGMWGADDPDDRMPMVWEDLTYADQALDPTGAERPSDPVSFDVEIFAFYKDVISLRQNTPVLRYGTFTPLHADAERNVIVFSRTLENEQFAVAIHRGDREYELAFDDITGLTGKSLQPVYSTMTGSERLAGTLSGSSRTLRMAPNEGMLLRVE